ncbi:MAG: hypothetical protein NTZ03_06495 [Actinobacteria bacterium]|nr:hypothetical protein [Actinomycetota bacterium]
MSKTRRIWGSLLLFAAAIAMGPTTIDVVKNLSNFGDTSLGYKASMLTAILAPAVALVAGLLCALGKRGAALGLAIASLALNGLSTVTAILGDKGFFADNSVPFSMGDELKIYLLGQGASQDGGSAFWPSLVAFDVVALLLLIAAVIVISTARMSGPTVLSADTLGSPLSAYPPPPGAPGPSAAATEFDEGEEV